MSNFEKFDQMINAEELNKAITEAKNNPQSTTKEIPADNYTVKIEKMEVGTTKDGRPMFKVQCRITDGEFKKWCLFMNRVLYGTKNDANMIASVVGWLEKLDTETVPVFKSYSQFAECVLDIFEEVADAIELDVTYDPDEFNSITINDIYDI